VKEIEVPKSRTKTPFRQIVPAFRSRIAAEMDKLLLFRFRPEIGVRTVSPPRSSREISNSLSVPRIRSQVERREAKESPVLASDLVENLKMMQSLWCRLLNIIHRTSFNDRR
jgi:hypothetical protein